MTTYVPADENRASLTFGDSVVYAGCALHENSDALLMAVAEAARSIAEEADLIVERRKALRTQEGIAGLPGEHTAPLHQMCSRMGGLYGATELHKELAIRHRVRLEAVEE